MQYGLQNAVWAANTKDFKPKKAGKHTCKICFTTDRHNQVITNSVVLRTEGSYFSVQRFGEKEWQTAEKCAFP